MKSPVITLKQALDRILLGPSQKHMSLFGIVSAYDATRKEIALYDHTRDIFRVDITTMDTKVERIVDENFLQANDKRKRLVIRVGDIVYVQRIVLMNGFSFKSKSVKDVMIFDTFTEEIVPKAIQTNPEISEEEMKKVVYLQQYHAKRLFDKLPQKRSFKDDFLYDLAFEVIYVERRSDRTIFVGWNGNVLKSYKSENLIKLDDLWYGISLHSKKCNIYDYDFLQRIYNDELLINLTVFDPFLEASDVVRLFDYVFMPNVLILHSKTSPDKFIYRYNCALKSSRSIRVCEPKSPIGRELSSRIEEYFLIDDKPTAEMFDESSVSEDVRPRCRSLSPIQCEKRPSDDSNCEIHSEEFISSQSYFPTSTPKKNISNSPGETSKQRPFLKRRRIIDGNRGAVQESEFMLRF